MANDAKNHEHMTCPCCYPAWGGLSAREAQPIGSQVQIPPPLAENLETGSAATEGCARATSGMVYDAGAHPDLNARIAEDNRAYTVLAVATILLLGLVLVGAAYVHHLNARFVSTLGPMPVVGSTGCPAGYGPGAQHNTCVKLFTH